MNSRKIFDVKNFALQANMSQSTFNRRFKETFNETAKNWLLLRKQEFVKRDVALSNLSFSEIAEKYKFSSTSYLVTFCKKYFGTQRYVPRINRIKFSAPIRPDTRVHLSLTYNMEKGSMTYQLEDADKPGKIYSSGSFTVLKQE